MRTITSGDPHKIAQKIGQARNIIERNLAKHGLDGIPQTRAYYNGIEARLNASGIDQLIVDAPADPPAKPSPMETVKPYSPVLIYVGSAKNYLSDIPIDTLSNGSMRYWASSLPESILDILTCNTIVIVEPKRVLTEAEARIINILLGKGRNVFVFPGADIAVYNAILLQLGSNLQLIPMTERDGVLTVITADTRTRYCIPVRWRGFLHPSKDHALSSTITDPFGKMMATSDVVSMSPVFYYNHSYTYVYGSEVLSFLESDNDGEGTADIRFVRNPHITEAIYPDDWTTLSETDIESWLSGLDGDFLRAIPIGYILKKDSNNYLTYEEKNTYDFMGSGAAYEKGKKLYAHSYSPYWLLSAYAQYLDDLTDVKNFCKWMQSPQNVNEGAFGNVFYPLFPFYYTGEGIDVIIQY